MLSGRCRQLPAVAGGQWEWRGTGAPSPPLRGKRRPARQAGRRLPEPLRVRSRRFSQKLWAALGGFRRPGHGPGSTGARVPGASASDANASAGGTAEASHLRQCQGRRASCAGPGVWSARWPVTGGGPRGPHGPRRPRDCPQARPPHSPGGRAAASQLPGEPPSARLPSEKPSVKIRAFGTWAKRVENTDYGPRMVIKKNTQKTLITLKDKHQRIKS